MPQLTFRVGADTLAATTAMDRLTAKVQEMTVKVGDSGDKFTQLDRNAEQLARRLGVELSGSTNKQIEAFKSLHDYLVKVGAPAKDVEASFKALQAAQEKYAEKAGPSFWDQHKTSILAAGTAIVGFGITAIKAFEESEKAGAQLDAVLKSTAGAAGVTREEAIKLSESLSKLNAVDDESILGAETILLQFTKIGKETFPVATQAVIDLAERMGKDLPSAALMVGKALDNPVEGMTALQRATGKFTDAEVEAIKTMVEHGQVAEAQAAVLDKLKEKFGGAGEAAAKTFSGAIKGARIEAENFMESVGGGMAPVLQSLIQSAPTLSTVFIGVGDAFGRLNISAGELLIAIPLLKTAFAGMASVSLAAIASFGAMAVAIGGVVAITFELVRTANAYKTARIAAFQADSVALKATEALEAQAKKYGITLEKGTKTQEQYNAALFKAIGEYEKSNRVVNTAGKVHTEYALEVAKTDKEVTKTVISHKGLSDRMKQNAEDAKALAKAFEGLNEKIIEFGLTQQAVAERRELLDQFQVELPEALQNIPPYIQDVEASMERMGITSTAALDALAAQANADFEAIAADATKSAHDIELAMAAMMDANAAATAAHGTKVTGEWASAADKIQTKWGESTKAVGDIWSKQVSTIVTDFSKGIADIIFEGKSFGDTMINIFKELGKSMLRALVETLFTPLKGLLNQALEWLGGLFSGGSGGGATGGVGGTIGSTVGGLGGIGAAGGLGGLGGLGGAVLGAGVGATVLGPMLGGGVGGTVAGATAGFIGAELIANIGASVAAGTGVGAGVTGFLSALGPVGAIIAGSIFGIGALIGLFTKRGKQKLHDTAIMEPFGKELWKARDAYHSAAALGDPDKEAQAREALLVSGITGWNEIVKAFELKSSADSQRKYIYDWIAAVNWDFLDKWKSYPEVKAPDTSYLPVQVMAEGGSGTVMKPTLFLAGEGGAEDFAFSPRSKGGLGNFYQTVTIEKVETSDPEKFVDMLVGMAQTNRAGTKKRLKTVLA